MRRTRAWFTGDTFGLGYREMVNAQRPLGHCRPPTPVQFEPEPLQASVERLLAREPQRVYVTHYGRVPDAAARSGRCC